MARVTVEDCIQLVPDRFELVMVAAQRARKIGAGAPLTIERDRDKNPVVSLREIAGSTVALDGLKEDVIKGHQRMVVYEENDSIDLMHGEKEWGTLAEGGVQAQGMYAEDEMSEDDEDEAGDEAEAEEGEASLADLAGDTGA